MSALVEIRNLTKLYIRGKQKAEVLHGVNIDIAPGDFPHEASGSGNTTLLNLIGGLYSAPYDHGSPAPYRSALSKRVGALAGV